MPPFITMIHRIVVICLILWLNFPAHTARAQAVGKRVTIREQTWFGYFNQTRFSNKWGLWLDIHYRLTDEFLSRQFQFVFRPAATYYVTDNLRVNVGYAYLNHFPAKGMNTARHEHRPWQQLWLGQKYQRLSTRQTLRLEQRFNEKVVSDVKQEGFNYTFRVRYNMSLFIPLNTREQASGTFFIALADEVFLNFGENIVYNTFDQNRLFAGLGYQPSPTLNVQLGYMNVFQQEATGLNYVSSNSIRLYVLHSFDLRGKTED